MSLEMIKTLRERTHLGLTECKNALTEASGDLDLAIEILQKKGLKKVDDLLIPLEGEVRALANGLVFELNCQTDFAARGETFKALADYIAANIEGVYRTDMNLNEQFKEEILAASKVLGKKIALRRIVRCGLPTVGKMVVYNHMGGKIAVVLAIDTGIVDVPRGELGENIAMQIAAMKPLGIDRDNLDPELVAKKKASFEEEAVSKPEMARTKIVEGKLNKWLGEVVLLDQESLIEPKVSIRKQLERFPGMKLVSFVRLERGEQ